MFGKYSCKYVIPVTRISLNQILHGNCKVIFTVVLTLIVLNSCKPLSETSDSYISKKEVVDTALEIASTSRPEISGAQITPYNITSEQMTLNEAVKHIDSKDEVAVGYNPDLTVGFVRMEGIWLDEFQDRRAFQYQRLIIIMLLS